MNLPHPFNLLKLYYNRERFGQRALTAAIVQTKHSAGHIQSIDVYRGIAILSVFLFHCLSATFGYDELTWNGPIRNVFVDPHFLLFYPLAYGRFGVAIFFVVSGFCIHLSVKRSAHHTWLVYLHKRFFRIYPPYLASVLLFFYLPPLVSFDVPGGPTFINLLAHLTLLHNLDPSTLFGINGSFWSVAVEVQLYLLYPLSTFFSARYGWNALLVLALVVEGSIRFYASLLGAQYQDSGQFSGIMFSPFGFSFSWCLGAYLCEYYLCKKRIPFLDKPVYVYAAIALIFTWVKPLDSFSFPLFSVLTASCLQKSLTRTPTLVQTKLTRSLTNHIIFLGSVSYSFYLFHQPILNMLSAILKPHFSSSFWPSGGLLFSCIGLYPLLLLISHAGYILLEKPSIRFGSKLKSLYL